MVPTVRSTKSPNPNRKTSIIGLAIVLVVTPIASRLVNNWARASVFGLICLLSGLLLGLALRARTPNST
jgi:hypothetical protein